MSGTGFAFHVLIPARLASTRLPNKPLADLAGIPMVVRVAQQAARSGAASVTVATDSEAVRDACAAHGVAAVLTRADHPSGSDRLAEAAAALGWPDSALVVNLQGDEPLLDPELVDACARCLDAHPDCEMATVAHPLRSAQEWASPHVVKLVHDRDGRALYFSRAPIPAWRDAPAEAEPAAAPAPVLRHVGLYAYRVGYLKSFPRLEPSPLEQAEMLEQLRVLWHGGRIAVHVTDAAPAAGVDTPEDLERVRQALATAGAAGAASG